MICFACGDEYYSLADKEYIREYGICYICDDSPEADQQFERCVRIAAQKLSIKDDENDD